MQSDHNDARCFLLLACYVPNVAKRSIWDQCNIEDRLTNNRPKTNLCSWKNFKQPYLQNVLVRIFFAILWFVQ